MGKIFCLMGKSSTGKDTILKLLLEDTTCELKPVVTYTTRPIREKEVDGVEYYFVNEKKIFHFKKSGKIIEERKYNTSKGVWYYCTVDDGQIDLQDGNYILITTLQSFENIKKYFGVENVIPLYITLNDELRLQRAFEREKQQKNPDYNEMCRRFLADNDDFREEELNKNNIKEIYENIHLDKCIDIITINIKNFFEDNKGVKNNL